MTTDSNTNPAPAGERRVYSSDTEYYEMVDAAEARAAANVAAKAAARAGAAAPPQTAEQAAANARAAAEARTAGLSASDTMAPPPPTARAAAASVDDAAAARQSAVDEVIRSIEASRGSDTSRPATPPPSMTYNSAEDAYSVRGQLPNGNDVEVPEIGVDPQHEYARIHARVTELQAKLDAHTFDPKTGAQIFDVTGEQRTILEGQLERARLSAGHDINALNKLIAQRNERAARAANARAEEVAKASFSAGDQTRAKMLDDALARLEAEDVAKAIIAARRTVRR